MRFEFKPSLDRSVKAFHGREKEEIKQVALQVIDILSHDRISHILLNPRLSWIPWKSEQ